jgi:ABC-type polysaccharide/polyol phosphate transport system ATPase subunit
VPAQPPPVAAAAPYAIDVVDLGVQYDLRFNRKTTVRQSIANVVTRKPPPRFWALRHVDVRLVRGESLAVIGPNGAGKSTLLQVLAGIMRPTEGRVDVRGQISGLLGLGAAFDADLSGIENILLGGAFLGVDDARIRELLPSIVDFADLGQFIDAPIRTYSSGMRARLGFAIATSVDPDILLLDEVLSTGDAAFREKSKARVIDLVGSAKAVVLVTHDMEWVKEYCNRAILLEKGRLAMEGEPAEVVAMHLEHAAEAAAARAAAARAGGLDPRVQEDRRDRRRRRRIEARGG